MIEFLVGAGIVLVGVVVMMLTGHIIARIMNEPRTDWLEKFALGLAVWSSAALFGWLSFGLGNAILGS